MRSTFNSATKFNGDISKTPQGLLLSLLHFTRHMCLNQQVGHVKGVEISTFSSAYKFNADVQSGMLRFGNSRSIILQICRSLIGLGSPIAHFLEIIRCFQAHVSLDPLCGTCGYRSTTGDKAKCSSGVLYENRTCTHCADDTNECCVSCQAGRAFYTSSNGSLGCRACEHGRYQPQNDSYRDKCKTCPLGQFYISSAYCEPCYPGLYRNNATALRCTPCSAGRYEPLHGSAAACKACRLGTFQDAHGMTSCKTCAAGEYLDREESAGPCPVSSKSLHHR